MSTPLTLEMLLELVEHSTTTIYMPTTDDAPEWMRSAGESFEVIDAKSLIANIEAKIAAQPAAVFANLVGMQVDDAWEAVKNRAPYLKAQHPVEMLIPINEQHGGRSASEYAKPGCLVVLVRLATGEITQIVGIS